MESGHPPPVMLLYNNVAQLRQLLGGLGSLGRRPPITTGAVLSLYRFLRRLTAAGAINLDVQIADLLPQGVAVDAEQIGGADLIAASCRQRR